MNIKGLATRSVSGIIYVGLIVACILLGWEAVTALSILFAILAMVEFNKITNGSENKGKSGTPLLLLDIAGAISLAIGIYGWIPWLVIMFVRLIAELYVGDANPLRSMAFSVFSQIYIGLSLGMMPTLQYFCEMYPLLAIFILIWFNDTGAFLVGSAIGRNKLFERISPKKSWEGFFGGLAFCVIASVIFCATCSSFFCMPANYFIWIGFGVLVSIVATFGDLVESMIKRSYHIKDSGNLIPGHGGILDRIDSLLFVLPIATIYILFINFTF